MAHVADTWHATRDGERVRTTRHGVGKRWQAVWLDPATKRERTRAFAAKAHAERYAVAMESSKSDGSYVDPRAGRVTLRSYTEREWLPTARLHLRPSTLETYMSHLSTHVLPVLGDHQLSSIRRPVVQALVGRLSTSLAPTTVETVTATLRTVLAQAVEDERIAHNPATRLKLPRIERVTIEPLSSEAVLALADVIAPRYRVAVFLAAGAGLRAGEVLGLTVPRVDLLRRRLRVEQQAVTINGAEPHLGPPKTESSRRTVPLDDVVLDAVAAHLVRYPARVLPMLDERGRARSVELLITNRIGGPVRRSSFGHCWARAVRDAELAAGTRFHDLRHYYASALIAAGEHPKIIQHRMGHASITETMDTYGHLFPESVDSGRGAIDRALASASVLSRSAHGANHGREGNNRRSEA
jgi:integrase